MNNDLDYNTMNDKALSKLIKDSITAEGCNYKQIAEDFNIRLVRARLLLSGLKRSQQIHISGWEEKEPGLYLGIYKVGNAKNAAKPVNKYNAMEFFEMCELILQELPATKPMLGAHFRVPSYTFNRHLMYLEEKGRVVIDTPPKGTKLQYFKRVGDITPIIRPTPKVVTTAPKNKQELTIPWKGYNKHRNPGEIKTVWRHAIT